MDWDIVMWQEFTQNYIAVTVLYTEKNRIWKLSGVPDGTPVVDLSHHVFPASHLTILRHFPGSVVGDGVAITRTT